MGLVIASNIDVLVPNLITLVDYHGLIRNKGSNSELTKETENQIVKLVEYMKPKNLKIYELIEFARKGFFVDSKATQDGFDTPFGVEKTLVKKRIKETNERILNGEPFLLLSFSGIQKRIAQNLLKAAFESVIPIRNEINQLIMPLV